jgi:hypothetical protein
MPRLRIATIIVGEHVLVRAASWAIETHRSDVGTGVRSPVQRCEVRVVKYELERSSSLTVMKGVILSEPR